MKLYLIRHGETFENEKGIIQGHHDGTLNEVGKAQAQQVAKKLATIQFDKIYSSDLSRAVDTAIAIQGEQSTACEVIKTQDLRERSYGIYDNYDKQKLKEEHGIQSRPDFYKIIYYAPGSETDKACYDRARRVIAMISANDNDANICCVSHGGFSRALYLEIEGLPDEEKYDQFVSFGNTAISIFEKKDTRGFDTISLNDTSHLG